MLNSLDDLLYRSITDVMERRFSRIDPDAAVSMAFRLISADPDHVVFVTDPSTGKLMGVITLEDQRKAESATKAADLATPVGDKLVGIRARAYVGQLLRLMDGENKLNRPIENIPVVDDEDRLVGFVNRKRLKAKLGLLSSSSFSSLS